MIRQLLLAAIFGALLLLGQRICVAQPAIPAPPEDAVKNDPLREAVWKETLHAGQNVRYWSDLSGEASRRELKWGIISVVLGLSAVTIPMLFQPKASSKLGKWFMRSCHVLNIAAFGVAIVLLLNNSSNYNQLSSIHKQWVAMKAEWESLLRKRDEIPRDLLKGHVDALEAQKKAIEIPEPSETDHEAMHQAWLAEMRARGLDEWIAKVEQAREEKPN